MDPTFALAAVEVRFDSLQYSPYTYRNIKDVMLRQSKPVQHEVKPRSGSIAGSRFYIIEPSIMEDGYSVQVRRVGGEKVVWCCAVSFETAAAFGEYEGNAIEMIIEQAKSDLDNEFIK